MSVNIITSYTAFAYTNHWVNMKAVVLSVSVVLALGFCAAIPGTVAVAQNVDFVDAFRPGERLEFEGRFGIIRLGEATMTVMPDDTVRGLPSRHLQLAITASVAGVYRLDDRFDSWVDHRYGLSRRFVQDIRESNQLRRSEYEIFPDSGFYRQSDVDSVLPTVSEPLDETAFLYWVRTLDMDVGDTLVIDRYFQPDRNPVTVAAVERDTIDVPAGRFTTIVLHPVIPDGGLLFSEEADARIWISDDPRRLVVQMKVKMMSYLTLALRLTEFVLADSVGSD